MEGRSRLLRNDLAAAADDTPRFVDVTDRAGIAFAGYGCGATAVTSTATATSISI